MAETYKKLGSVAPTDNSEQTLYTTPASTETLVSNITVTNRSSNNATFDIAVYDSPPTREETKYDFIVVGEISGTTYNEVHRSTDGLTWTTATAQGIRPDELDFPHNDDTSLTWWEHEQKYIVAVNNGSVPLWQSTDATIWTGLGGLSRPGMWTSNSVYNVGVATGQITYAFNPEGKEILYTQYTTSNNTPHFYSNDGGTFWTFTTIPGDYNSSGNILSVSIKHSAYGKGKFVVMRGTADLNTVSVSENGTSWTTTTLAQSFANSNNKLVFAKDYFFAWETTVTNPVIQYSNNGESWGTINSYSIASGRTWKHILEYKDGYLFLSSNGSYYTTDLFTWSTEITGAMTDDAGSYLYNGKNLVYVSSGGDTKTITDPHTPNTGWDDETTDRFTGNHYVGVVRKIKDYSAPTENFLYTQSEILPNETLVLETGVCLSASGTIAVRENFVDNTTYDGTTATSDLTFSAYGVEIS